ncbi:MAG: SLATT domain-containing protein [Hyphomicrobiaceae bacterium]
MFDSPEFKIRDSQRHIFNPAVIGWYAEELAKTRASYLRDWSKAKSIRFNAAKRLERKQDAISLAFALAGIVGIILPFFVLLFDTDLSHRSKTVLSFYGFATGALALGLGLIELARGYGAKARRFDECGRRINSVLRKLRNNPAFDEAQLDDLIREYARAVDVCDLSHNSIDYEKAVAQEDLDIIRVSKGRELELSRAESLLRSLNRKESAGIYWLYWLVLIAPAVPAVGIWLLW